MYSFGWLHLTRDFLGIQNNLKIPGSALVSSPGSSANKVQLTFYAAKILKLGKSAGELYRVNSWSRDLLRVSLGALTIFLDFFRHSIRSHGSVRR